MTLRLQRSNAEHEHGLRQGKTQHILEIVKEPTKFRRGARHGRVLRGLRAAVCLTMQPDIQKTHPNLKVFAASCMSMAGAVGRV